MNLELRAEARDGDIIVGVVAYGQSFHRRTGEDHLGKKCREEQKAMDFGRWCGEKPVKASRS